MIGIYSIINPNGRIYIGQSKDLDRRFDEYNSGKDYGYRLQRRLNRSLKKYGADKHEFGIVEFCTIEELNSRERHWQEFFKVLSEYGLNCKYQNADDKPVEFSECTRKKMSEAKKGKDPWNKGKKGVQSSTRKGVPLTEEHKQKFILTSFSKGHTPWNKGVKTGCVSSISKKVIDIETGEIFDSIAKAADKININATYLRRMLSGERKNKTSIRYYTDNN